MYYKDHHGNEFSNMGQYSNSIHPGGISMEHFGLNDATNWADKYKMWFVYALVIIMLMVLLKWWMSSSKYDKKSPASVFY
jgi:hypothetical protein